MYRCLKCGEEIKLDNIHEKIRCPICGFRIGLKDRDKKIKKVEAL